MGFNVNEIFDKYLKSEGDAWLRNSADEGRAKFRERFHQDYWNHPCDVYSGMDEALSGSKALVIAIQYFPPHMLWSTFPDAYNVADMLETRFKYSPKCIRVLADQATPMDKKDRARWPTKENIMEGLRWLSEGCVDGCRRLLYFAGHAYTSSPGERASGFEGILPVDYDMIIKSSTESDAAMKQIVLSETVLFDRELIGRLVDNLPDVKLRLTALFDCNFDDEISRYNPTTVIPRNIRGHTQPAEAPRLPGPATKENYMFGPGNILGLPKKIDPGSNNPASPSESATQIPKNCELKSFPPGCEVICWYSSAPIRDRQFTTNFTKGVDHLALNGGFTFKDLNGYMSQALDSRCRQVQPEGEERERVVLEHQLPKVYVSDNIAGFVCDTEMYI